MFKRKKDIEERQVHRLVKAMAARKPEEPKSLPVRYKRRTKVRPHSVRQLIYGVDNRIDVDASAEAIGRTLHEIMRGTWPRDSAESRIGYALRASNPGSGGIISREQWLQENPEQLEMFPR
jgi:hypothetical protein